MRHEPLIHHDRTICMKVAERTLLPGSTMHRKPFRDFIYIVVGCPDGGAALALSVQPSVAGPDRPIAWKQQDGRCYVWRLRALPGLAVRPGPDFRTADVT